MVGSANASLATVCGAAVLTCVRGAAVAADAAGACAGATASLFASLRPGTAFSRCNGSGVVRGGDGMTCGAISELGAPDVGGGVWAGAVGDAGAAAAPADAGGVGVDTGAAVGAALFSPGGASCLLYPLCCGGAACAGADSTSAGAAAGVMGCAGAGASGAAPAVAGALTGDAGAGASAGWDAAPGVCGAAAMICTSTGGVGGCGAGCASAAPV